MMFAKCVAKRIVILKLLYPEQKTKNKNAKRKTKTKTKTKTKNKKRKRKTQNEKQKHKTKNGNAKRKPCIKRPSPSNSVCTGPGRVPKKLLGVPRRAPGGQN